MPCRNGGASFVVYVEEVSHVARTSPRGGSTGPPGGSRRSGRGGAGRELGLAAGAARLEPSPARAAHASRRHPAAAADRGGRGVAAPPGVRGVPRRGARLRAVAAGNRCRIGLGSGLGNGTGSGSGTRSPNGRWWAAGGLGP